MTKGLNVLKRPGWDGGERKQFGKGITVPRKTRGDVSALIACNFLCIHYAHSQASYYFDAIILWMALFLFLFF